MLTGLVELNGIRLHVLECMNTRLKLISVDGEEQPRFFTMLQRWVRRGPYHCAAVPYSFVASEGGPHCSSISPGASRCERGCLFPL